MLQMQEVNVHGQTVIVDAVRFKNPTDREVRLTGVNAILRETQIQISHTRAHQLYKKPGAPSSTGVGRFDTGMDPYIGPNGVARFYAQRRMDIIVSPGKTIDVPFDVANALQSYTCLQCTQTYGHKIRWYWGDPSRHFGPRVCFDESHTRTLIGGLAPQLMPVDANGLVQVHENLKEEPAPEPIASNGHDSLHMAMQRRRKTGSQ